MKDDISSKMLDSLDEISVLQLELMDELITCKKEMENYLREGYFMLGKARYIMGVHSVSQLQIPSDECDVTSVILSHASEETFLDALSLKNYQFSIVPSPIKNVEKTEEDTEKEEGSSELRKRGEPEKSNSSMEDIEKSTPIMNNPINWFSGLPPQSLRKAQEYFKQALLKSAECATIQSKLYSINVKATVLS